MYHIKRRRQTTTTTRCVSKRFGLSLVRLETRDLRGMGEGVSAVSVCVCTCVCACVSVWVCVCSCVCVLVRERDFVCMCVSAKLQIKRTTHKLRYFRTGITGQEIKLRGGAPKR